jgi:heme/copper-type cytochrome/quinol oxidase subunit 3
MAAEETPQPASAHTLAEPPELQERNLWVAARLLAGATIMFFLAFVFAYFYLRSFNNNDNWRPGGIDPPHGYGAVIVILFLLSAGAFGYASRAARAARPWFWAAGASLVLGLAGVVVQAFEWAHLGFTPSDGGYASVFEGWTITFAVLVLPAMYWVETTLATGLRNRSTKGYVPHGMSAASFYWSLLVAVGVVAWFVLYVL